MIVINIIIIIIINNIINIGIKQFYIAIEREEWKLETLIDLYKTLTITQAIIYCNTRRKVLYSSVYPIIIIVIVIIIMTIIMLDQIDQLYHHHNHHVIHISPLS
jgi:hypothetical protein